MAVALGFRVTLTRAGLASLTAVSMFALVVTKTAPADAYGLRGVGEAMEGVRRASEMSAPGPDGAPASQQSIDEAREIAGEADKTLHRALGVPAGPPDGPMQSAQPAPQMSSGAAAPYAKDTLDEPVGSNAVAGKPVATEQTAAPLPVPAPDYYAERAKGVLAAEKKGDIKMHPLQVAEPDHDITLCEAGCGQGGPQVLLRRPKTEAVSAADPGRMMRSAALKQGAECVGGCGEPSHFDSGAPLKPGSAPRMMDPSAGAWMTNVAPSGGKAAAPMAATPKAAASMARAAKTAAKAPAEVSAMTGRTDAAPASPRLPVQPAAEAAAPQAPVAVAAPMAAAPTVAPGTKPAAKASSAPAKSASPEDWMARINRERAEKKASAGM